MSKCAPGFVGQPGDAVERGTHQHRPHRKRVVDRPPAGELLSAERQRDLQQRKRIAVASLDRQLGNLRGQRSMRPVEQGMRCRGVEPSRQHARQAGALSVERGPRSRRHEQRDALAAANSKASADAASSYRASSTITSSGSGSAAAASSLRTAAPVANRSPGTAARRASAPSSALACGAGSDPSQPNSPAHRSESPAEGRSTSDSTRSPTAPTSSLHSGQPQSLAAGPHRLPRGGRLAATPRGKQCGTGFPGVGGRKR